MERTSYDFKTIENKWSRIWKETNLYLCDINNSKNPFYNLWMFPYPSGARMHVGHAYASTGSDIIGRFKRMQGFDVFQPMGFDAFGIHGENYAIKVGKHPSILMEDLCNRFRDEQFMAIGHGYDWGAEVRTYDPAYYKWTQWLFLKLFKAGLAERKEASVNWCSSCQTVLADEQVISGECERCHSKVSQKILKQWFFKITKYAERLLTNLDKIDWSKKVVEAQRNWIGKSEGAVIKFNIKDSTHEITVFTTRPDTLYGATYIVLAPEHPIVNEISANNQKEVNEYKIFAKSKTDMERSVNKEKTGVFTGSYAINPLTKEEIPIWISDFVLLSYGEGAIMAVPAHDARDFDFAKKFNLPIVPVINSPNIPNTPNTPMEVAFENYGTLINSGEFNGLDSKQAGVEIVKKLEKMGCGNFAVNYKLRDWLISRQRYWSAPIPIVYCKKCGTVPVLEKDLPVKLPFVEDWKPKGDGRGPLANVEEFVNTKCPNCQEPAERETDTLDNFLDSGWYFFRYPYANRHDVPFGYAEESFKKWFPVHLYIGGAEHSVLHLMYTRFLTMALHDMGIVDFDEPFVKFFAHGLVTKDGKKMSKSLGNIVNPDEYIVKIGADAFRIYLMFMGPYSEGGDFSDAGIRGVTRFLERFYTLVKRDVDITHKSHESDESNETHKLLAKTIAKVTSDIESFHFNTAIASLMSFVNSWEKSPLNKADIGNALKILAPFAPFITEELWQEYYANNGKDKFISIHKDPWPTVDISEIKDDLVQIPITIQGKFKATITIPIEKIADKEFVLAKAYETTVVKNICGGKPFSKEIYVVGKIVNFAN